MGAELLEDLARPFEGWELGILNRKFTYVEGHRVIHRLNEVLGLGWNFEIVKSWKEEGLGLCVLGRITLTSGASREGIGYAEIKRKRDGSGPVDLGNDWKAATTDALKKAATLFGVALHLYDSADPSHQEVRRTQNQEKPPAHRQKRHSRAQAEAFKRLAKDLGTTSKQLTERCQQLYGRTPRYLTAVDADDLIRRLEQAKGSDHGA